MPHLKHVCAAVAIATSLSCGSPSAPSAPAGPFDITGRVTDFVTGAGVSSVALKFGTAQATTDASGNYTVRLVRGEYQIRVSEGDRLIGTAYVGGPSTRGDVFVNGGVCSVRYGAVVDAFSGRPLSGARLNGGQVTTDASGWYRVDYYGCSGSCGSCNTTVLAATANGYKEGMSVLGRGVQDVLRLDFHLQPE